MRIIAGEFKNRIITAPKGVHTRPSSSKLREALFNICQHSVQDANVLDLYAGSGAIGLEALSRGAKSATFVDANKESIKSIKKNLSDFNVLSRADVFGKDVFSCLDNLEKKKVSFDIVFADPPYNQVTQRNGKEIQISRALLEFFQKSSLLPSGATFFLEEGLEVLNEKCATDALFLVSKRRMGRSCLLQFEKE